MSLNPIMIPTWQVKGMQQGRYMEGFRDKEFVLVVLVGPVSGWRNGRHRKGRRISCKN